MVNRTLTRQHWLKLSTSSLLVILTNYSLANIAPLNFLLPDDPNFVIQLQPGCHFQFEALNQFGVHDIKARRDFDDPLTDKTIRETVNVLQIWNKDQSGLDMLRGFSADTPIGELAAKLNSANDDGVRGHMLPTAQLHGDAFSGRARYQLLPSLTFNVSVPFYRFKLSDVQWQDLTLTQTMSDLMTKEYLTDQFTENVLELSHGLDIKNGWSQIGIGDVMAELRWDGNFPQPARPILKNVWLSVRSGLTFPTGLRKNENQLFSLPFGNDGSLGLTLGGGIDLTWAKVFHGNLNVDFLELFGTTRARRFKTNLDQTDLVFLAYEKARLKPGFTQRFNLGVSAQIYQGWSLAVAYEHLKHHADTLSLYNNLYSSEIANTAASLQGWSTHDIIARLNYTGRANFNLFYKHPFNGRHTLLTNVAGIEFSVDF